MADRVALYIGVAIMAWAQWGNAAQPDATFAFGAGLVALPTLKSFASVILSLSTDRGERDDG